MAANNPKPHEAPMRQLLISLAIIFALGVSSSAAPFANGPQDDVVTIGKTKKTVKPCNEHTNEDGVKVVNNCESSGNATIDPKVGNANSETDVTTKSGFEGEVTGIDQNDTVDLGSNNEATVSGEGGTVNVGGGSTVTCNNGTGGGNMTINLSSGSSISLPPGSSITIST